MKRTLMGVVLFCALASCQPKSPTGIVPAELRDLERAGEGLVGTTFGPYPGRAPDWTRAAGVLSIAKDVWKKGKAASPSLPSKATADVDAALVTLDTAIAMKDQKSAVIASNVIGLAVPDLFDFFHPDAPKGVVRMDAVFRQLGIDAHFGNAATGQDLESLKTDWKDITATVSARVPTCHRVGGTATVTDEINASLSNAEANRSVAATLEQESENGALEVDTLELLFDCPPDGAAPDKGLGSHCTDDSTCEAGQRCDKTNAGGTCAPDPAKAHIGTPCTTTNDCGTDARSTCQTEAGDNYPGGYCFMEPCNDVQVCPAGSTCVALGGETPGCFKSCVTDADCRTGEGYVCQRFVTAPPTGFGPSDHACAFKCTRDADCQRPLTCDIAAGTCKP